MPVRRPRSLSILIILAAVTAPAPAGAHCDTLDGPVVAAAREALDAADLRRVLVWVRAEDEPEIRDAFERALAVRRLGGEAGALAERWFFETLVRVHRAAEGAPYTGLRPAGADLGPAIPLADRALASGDPEPLVELITAEIAAGLRQRFAHARGARDYPPADVAAGREFVHAYVGFMHYAERAWEAAASPAAGHAPEAAPGEHRHE